jgi:hypothetical protein
MRVVVEERYPGEAQAKAGEMLKALAARLGAHVHEDEPHAEADPCRVTRDLTLRIGALASKQFQKMQADVERLLREREGKGS